MTAETKQKEPVILSIGGGKGGVGKSMVSTNLAVQYAQAGLKIILIDLDIGAANVHTIFGIRNPPKGLGDYFMTARSQLSDYLIETPLRNLKIVPGSGFIPELANLKHVQKTKLINHIKALDADLVLLDLGAGSSVNIIDFFSMTHAGIVVTTPEPTAIVNAYEFLKNVIYRILFRIFRNQEEILEILKVSTIPNNPLNLTSIRDLVPYIAKKYAWAAKNIEEICGDLEFYIVFNQSRKLADAPLGKKLHQICQRYLNLNLNFSGLIFFNEEVSASVFKMSPISLASPDSITSQTLKRIAITIFNQVAHKLLNKQKPSFDIQFAKVIAHAKQDFEINFLTQKRLQRNIKTGLSSTAVGIPGE